MNLLPSNPWALLLVAAALEIVWAVSLKSADGFTRLFPTIVTIVAAVLSFWLLAQAMRHLPVGTAYAVWTGIGAVGTAILGMVWFGDPATWTRAVGIGFVVAGIATLKFG